jgi:hypothetical protein
MRRKLENHPDATVQPQTSLNIHLSDYTYRWYQDAGAVQRLAEKHGEGYVRQLMDQVHRDREEGWGTVMVEEDTMPGPKAKRVKRTDIDTIPVFDRGHIDIIEDMDFEEDTTDEDDI